MNNLDELRLKFRIKRNGLNENLNENEGWDLLTNTHKEILLAIYLGETRSAVARRMMLTDEKVSGIVRAAPRLLKEGSKGCSNLSDGDLIDLLKSVGTYLTKRKWDSEKRTPTSRQIEKQFVQWNRAWRLAGVFVPKPARFSDEDLIQALKNRGEYVLISVWNAECESPSSTVITKRFGDWRSAWEKAEISVPLPEMVAVNHSKLSDARAIAKLTKKSLAEKSGVQVHIIERLESEYGSDKVEAEKVKNLAKALEVSVEDLQI